MGEITGKLCSEEHVIALCEDKLFLMTGQNYF